MAASSLNHGLVDRKEYTLNLGSSFQPRKANQSFHLMRYDFKPSSVDSSRPAEVQIGSNNECTVVIPNANDSTTTYKGGKKPCTKECVLIIDKKTGEVTLERISSNIPLKKSRGNSSLNKNKLNPTPKASNSQNSSQSSSASGSLKQTSSQSSNSFTNSPVKHKTHATQPTPPPVQQAVQQQTAPSNHAAKPREFSATSTSDSSSSDSSDSDSETEKEMAAHIEDTFSIKPYQPPPPSKPAAKSGSFSTLQNDLQLSDSNESDSD